MVVSDQTVMLTAQAIQANMAAMRAKAERAAGRPGQQTSTASPTNTPTGSVSQSMITNWHENTLKDVERQLAQHIGPMAKVMVRKAASSTADVHELYTMLANNLDTEGAKREFLGGLTRLGVTPPPTSAGTGTRVVGGTQVVGTRVVAGTVEPIPQQTIDLASRQLAKYLGPIASVMVKKAARDATSLQLFYTTLADNISNLDERSKFLKEVGQR
jgi:serine/threonine-protein kinase